MEEKRAEETGTKTLTLESGQTTEEMQTNHDSNNSNTSSVHSQQSKSPVRSIESPKYMLGLSPI